MTDSTRSEAYRDDRAHVFHSWSAQERPRPAGGRRRRGLVVLGRGRQALPRLLVAAGEREHRPPAPEAGRRHQGAGRPRCARSPRSTPTTPAARRPASSPSWRPATSTWCSSPTAAPRPPRTPSAWPGSTPAATRCWPPTAATTAPPPARSPSPATPAAGRASPALPGVVHFWGPYPYRSAFHATTEAEECERALAHLADTLMVEGPHTVAAIILETGGRHQRHPRAARRLPRRRPRAVRRARHRDDRRRGHGRLRPLRRVVRRRPLGRRARPHLLRQGRELAATCRSAG